VLVKRALPRLPLCFAQGLVVPDPACGFRVEPGCQEFPHFIAESQLLRTILNIHVKTYFIRLSGFACKEDILHSEIT
jgi:hypothetical protein